MLLCMSRARLPSALPRAASAVATLAVVLVGCGTAASDPAQASLAEPRSTSPSRSEASPSTAVPAAVGRLDAESRAALERAAFPVLLFPARWTSQVMSIEGQRWVAVAAHDDGLHVSLHGSDVAHPDLREDEVANIPTPTTLVRGSPAWITLNEQIRSAAWHEGAVAWSLEVECDRPFEDTRCTEDEFVRALAETLESVDPQVLGGAR